MEEWGEPQYRPRQVYEGVTKGLAGGYEQLTPLPAALRRRLADAEPLRQLETVESQRSADGTIKLRFTTRDGFPVEAVAMSHRNRRTVCVSSQSGCPLACTFCATGSMGLGRNLAAGEIAEQVTVLAAMLRERGRAGVQRGDDGHGRAVPELRRGARRPAAPSTTRPASAWVRARSRSRRPGGCPASSGWRPSRCRSSWRCRCTLPTTAAHGADARHAPLPAGQADRRLPRLPRGHPAAHLRRVPDAGRGQRQRRAGRTAGRPAGPRRVPRQPDRLQPDRLRLPGVVVRPAWRGSPPSWNAAASRPATAGRTARTSMPPAGSWRSRAPPSCAANGPATAAARHVPPRSPAVHR